MKLKYIYSPLTNAPDFLQFGFLPLTLLSSWGFFRTQGGQLVTDQIDMKTVERVANHSWWDDKKNAPIVFDIEVLPTATRDRPLRDHVHDQLIQVVNHYRNHSKHQHKALGFYGEFPVRDFFRATGLNGPEAYSEWQEENGFFLSSLNDTTLESERGLSSYVDRIYCDIYYWYPDRIAEFEKYADENLRAAAVYNKPIIAYVSPNVQTGTMPFWEPGVWRDMLSYVWTHPLVDGVSVFGTSRGQWDDSAAWWVETLEVLNA